MRGALRLSSTAFRGLFAAFLLGCGGAESAPVAVAVPPQPPAPSHTPSAAPPPTSAPLAAAPPFSLLKLGGTCGLDAGGNIWAFETGQLVAEVPGFTARAVACGPTHSCALAQSDGAMWCWGSGAYGALGNGSEKATRVPLRVAAITDVADMGVNFDRTCARTTNGDVYCWGDSEFGIAGDGRLPDNVGREKVLPGKAILKNATSLAVGTKCTCSLLPDAHVSCWGQNQAESCAQPAATRYVPRPLTAPKLKDIAAVALGASETCTIDKTGKVACFGQTNLDSYNNAPFSVALPAAAVEVVVGTSPHACARLGDGTVHCWGYNSDGQLGDGTKKDRLTTAAPTGVTGATALAVAQDRTCALVTGGRLLCWGKDISPTPIEVTQEKKRRGRH